MDNPLSLNRYTYTHNNPLRFVDPSGHKPDAEETPNEKKPIKIESNEFNEVKLKVKSALKETKKRSARLAILAEFAEYAALEVEDAIVANIAWNEFPATDRGQLIEDYLAETDYDDWWQIGAERNGYFPVIDFAKNGMVVSLKTIDLRRYKSSKAITNEILGYIDDIADRTIIYNENLVPQSNKILDIRIPKGTINLVDFVEINSNSKGIIVNVEEF